MIMSSMTPNRKLGYSLPPTPAPFLTPRPEKRPPFDLRWADGSSTTSRSDREREKDKEVNIQVVLRCRPLNPEEQKMNVQHVVSCNEQKNEVIVMQSMVNKQIDKTFTFDKVFGPKVQQRTFYDHAVSPIVHDVLEGFNCTVFAYGQTGTGKTYTMEGTMKPKGGDVSADAGVIPRAVRHIFDALEARKADYSMKVSFLELYNEEITDLLVLEDQVRCPEDRQKRPISLMEDGKGGAVIRGLEEVVVYGVNEVYSLLEHGAARRRTADTILNKQSSRSHAIFSITINVKEGAMGKEELIKCGRLNLVDLAGSENILRSGAKESRAREAGEMNKSLLTLGRVITALVERSSHIPYRDSKLTRLLRESLGGKTKTCIVATISPAVNCLEETMNTLDYAYRAKSIKNKPEVNQKFCKSVLLKDLYQEIERMKQEVRAAREKNGIYIPPEQFSHDEAEKKAMSVKVEALEFDLEQTRKEADRFRELYHTEQEKNLDLESEIGECKIAAEESKIAFSNLQEVHKETNLSLKEKEFIISNLLHSEQIILDHAKELRSNLECASGDMTKALAKIEQQSEKESVNHNLVLGFGAELDRKLKLLHKSVTETIYQHHESVRTIEEQVNSIFAQKDDATKCLELRTEKIKDIYTSGVLHMNELANALHQKAFLDIENMKSEICSQMLAVENFLITVVSEAEQVVDDINRCLSEQRNLLTFSTQQQEAGLQRNLVSTQAISKKTVEFLSVLQNLAADLTGLLEEKHLETTRCLTNFEEAFHEMSVKEEKQALEKIAEILTNLTAVKTEMVTGALGNMKKTCFDQKNILKQEVSDLQSVSDNAEREWIKYIERVETQIQEDTAATTKIKGTMENMLMHSSNKVIQSLFQWKNSEFSINQMNKDFILSVVSSTEKMNLESSNLLESLMPVSSENDAHFVSGITDLQTITNRSASLDHEARKQVNLISTYSLDHLKLLEDSHSGRINDIKSFKDKSLHDDYLVHDQADTIPTKIRIKVPSLASLEDLKRPIDELVLQYRSENRPKGDAAEGKQQSAAKMARNPLTPINSLARID